MEVGITGSQGANRLEICVSKTIPSAPARLCSPNYKSEARLRGLGGCRASLLGEQREFWASREGSSHVDIEMGGHFRQREQSVQRPWGRTGPGVLEEH